MRGGRRAPVTLRDFLELGCESSSDGFRSYPRCRPCEDSSGVLQKKAPAASPPVELSRSPSWSPSFFFFPGNKSPAGSALARISSLSRSFSRRISFWRRRDDYDQDLDERDSCGFPSPQVSSCCSSESSSSELLDIVIEEEEEEETLSSAVAPVGFEEASASAASSSSSTGPDHDCSSTEDVPGAAGNGYDEALDAGDPAVGRRKLETMEDKQQLSPVSVLDFPFDDDDGDEDERSDAGTSCFHHHHNCEANLQRKKMAQHKIRRFDDGPTTDAVDLELRFTTTTSSESGGGESVDDTHGWCTLHLPSNSCSTDDRETAAKTTTAPRHDYEHEEHQNIDKRSEQGQYNEEPAARDDNEYRLLARLLDADEITTASAAAIDEITEWLLLDFFAEGIARLHSSVTGPVVVGTTVKPLHDDVTNNKVTAALVDAAGEWLRGVGPQWGIADVMFSGESALKDMERCRRWMCVREEEQDVGAEVEAFVMDELLDDLVTDLLAPLLVCGDR